MKECDNSTRKIHISSNFILSISLLILFDTLLLRPSLHCNTPLHFITLHPTTLRYTSPHFTQLHFATLHHTSPNYTSLHFTALHPTTLHALAKVECIREVACNVMLTENSTNWSRRRAAVSRHRENSYVCLYMYVLVRSYSAMKTFWRLWGYEASHGRGYKRLMIWQGGKRNGLGIIFCQYPVIFLEELRKNNKKNSYRGRHLLYKRLFRGPGAP